MHEERLKLIAKIMFKYLSSGSIRFRHYYISLVLLLCGAKLKAFLNRKKQLKYALMFILEDFEFELADFEWDIYNKLLEKDTEMCLKHVLPDTYILGGKNE